MTDSDPKTAHYGAPPSVPTVLGAPVSGSVAGSQTRIVGGVITHVPPNNTTNSVSMVTTGDGLPPQRIVASSHENRRGVLNYNDPANHLNANNGNTLTNTHFLSADGPIGSSVRQYWESGTCRSLFPLLNWTASSQGILLILQFVIYFMATLVVSPQSSLWAPNAIANWRIGSSSGYHGIMLRCGFAYGVEDPKFLLEFRRLIAPTFLHVNLLHIGMNVYFQLQSGTSLNAEYGNFNFLSIFLISGVAGNLMSSAFSAAASVGASTACFGIIGVEFGRAMLIEYPAVGTDATGLQRKSDLRQHWMRIFLFVAVFEILNWAVIDHYGHLGGLLSGLCCAFCFEKRYEIVRVVTAVAHESTPSGGSLEIREISSASNRIVVPDYKRRWATFGLVFGIISLLIMIFGRSAPTKPVCDTLWMRYEV